MNPYTRAPLRPHTQATAEQINGEFSKIETAFAGVMAALANLAVGAGLPSFTWIAYADSSDGTANFTTGSPGARAFLGLAVNRLTPTPSQQPSDYAWRRLRGYDAPAVVLQFSVNGTDWHIGFQAGDLYWRQSVDGGDTFSQGEQLSAASLAEIDAAAAEKLAAIEEGADVTANALPRLEPASASLEVAADYQGTVLQLQLPRSFVIRRFRGAQEVSSEAAWSIASVTPAGALTASVNDGVVTVTACAQSGTIIVRSEHNDTTLDARIDVAKRNAAPPSGNGGATAGTTAHDSSFATVTGTGYIAISDVLTVKTGSAGTITMSAPLTALAEATSPIATFPVALQWRYRPVGGSFSDAGFEALSAPDPEIVREDYSSGQIIQSVPGFVNAQANLTGLSAATDYEVQLFGRRTTGGLTRAIGFSGTATAEGA